ncbi:cytochrome c5 [Natronocella acetinitrilica]|uniref:Cytochrome c5 n=1 Tax=Natronocella acetinitrilica TaxID=414046 RepID=A0AAE3G6H6_9GAMM|nr:cytochrome c5 [Natronocella acetinitrilica]
MSTQDDTAFMRTFIGVMIGLTVLAVILLALALFAGSFDRSTEQGRAELQRERLERNLRPASAVRQDGEAMPVQMASDDSGDDDDADDDVVRTGSDINESVCMACHAEGRMDAAPSTGDNSVWQALFDDKGLDELVHNAINGIRGMPARGGDSSLSDQEVRNAVIYMLEESDVDAGEEEET